MHGVQPKEPKQGMLHHLLFRAFPIPPGLAKVAFAQAVRHFGL